MFRQLVGDLPEDITPHVLRHSFASVANDLGLTDATVAAMLGHRGGTMTSRYQHVADAVTVQGWGRDMGVKELISYELSTLSIGGPVRNQPPAISSSFKEITVAWYQELKLTGSYRMQVVFSETDVIRLFKEMFGHKLSTSLIEEHGFTISPELTKAILRRVNLYDLILGDLKGEDPVTAEKAVEPAKVRPFPRRI